MLALLKNKTLWGLAVILALTLMSLLRGAMGMEWVGYRAGEALAPQRAPDPQVAVVAIAPTDLQKYGPWPWPRSYIAKLVETLSTDKVEVVALALDLSAPQNDQALAYLDQLKTLAADPDNGSTTVSAKLDEAHAALDTDTVLANTILRSGHVLLAAPGHQTSTASAPRGSGSPSFALQLDASTAPAVDLDVPLQTLTHAARGVGYLDEDSTAAQELPLLVQSDGHTVASLALLSAALQQGVDTTTISIHDLGGVSLGPTRIATDRSLEVLLRDGHSDSDVPQYSFDAIIDGSVPAERLAGKAVFVGVVRGKTAPFIREARLTSALLSSGLVAAPFWVWGVRAIVTLLVGLYLMLLLPRLSHVIGIALSAFLGIALLNGEYVPLLSQSLWVPLILPFMVLVFGHAGLAGLHFLRERSGVSRGATSELNRELGLAYQALNRFDQALARFRKCQPSEPLCENLMALGQEHERGRRYSQALEVYYFLQQIAPDYPGLGERLERLRQLESTPTLTGRTSGVLSRALASGGLQKPMLGRYELLQELGRGAMGVVYLGKDAKIGRQVAIKTMALADEFQGDTLKDAHDRFFREAETAGRLNHTNIVTIYDVGEDQGLAYIAMDFVAGESLQKYTASGSLLPLNEAVAVSIKIAEALDYAHKHNVVHRDIKPANIMYERSTGRVKITDFGIAAITDLSRTKTGTILGSPLYMSPEQVSGEKKLDGRSDLYSLGVTLYQLLRGELPFEAPSLTGLMFKIANEPHPDVTFLRPDIPPTVKVVVDRALQKDPDMRFKTGLEMANALRLSIGAKQRAS